MGMENEGMPPWERVVWARGVLGLGETATQREMEGAFKTRLLACHPDQHPDDPGATARTREILEAKGILDALCAHYRYSLVTPPEEDLGGWWREKFGDDPIWG